MVHATPDPATSAEARLEQRVEELARQLADVQAELARLRAERAAASAPPPAVVLERPPAPAEALSLWGYGEAYLTHPVHRPSDSQADLARAVFGIGYRFDERTSFNSEYEIEHAVTSASDPGEFEVEQFFIEHELAPSAKLRLGLFLMPFGFINEHHEPTNFYGMQRNFVEKLIIPSTWREGGVQFRAQSDSGLDFAGGVTTGLDLSKWSFSSAYPPYHSALGLDNSGIAPLQATHQELALANAQHPAGHVALNYTGIPGLRLGGALFSGEAVAPTAAGAAPRVTLWEGHARWAPAGFQLSALYARGTISQTAAANLANAGATNPIPAAFYGYLAEAAYSAGFGLGRYRLAPFLRYEYYNLGSAYSGAAPVLPVGLVPLSGNPGDLGPWPSAQDRVYTAGANFYLTPNVVVKLDYQSFDLNRDFSRVDLGLGLSF